MGSDVMNSSKQLTTRKSVHELYIQVGLFSESTRKFLSLYATGKGIPA